MEWDSNEFMYSMVQIMSMVVLSLLKEHIQNGHLQLGQDGFVSEVGEKKPISNIANLEFTIG